MQFQSGDRLLLYTSGIPEADNGNGEYLTTGPMLEIAKENLDLSAEELQINILQNFIGFCGRRASKRRYHSDESGTGSL